MFAFVAGFIGLDFEKGASLGRINLRPLAVGAFDFGAVNDAGVDAEFSGFLHFPTVHGCLENALNGAGHLFPGN